MSSKTKKKAKGEKKKKKVLLQLKQSWTDEELRAVLPLPSPNANKYTRGVLTVVAGSKRYPGAACLTSRAGQRMGAGYTEVITNKTAAGMILASAPSLVARNVKDWRPSELAVLKKGARHAVCIGPGFVRGDALTDELVLGVLKKAKCPVLVDGGGLAAIGSKKVLKALAKRQERGLVTIITPHTGEATRLQDDLRMTSDGPGQLSAVLAMATGAIVVMKGPDTYISIGKQIYPMYEGTPALAKAGTGDVLAGMISALLAQGTEPIGAAVLGATLHARAGIIAAQTYTAVSVTAEDVIEAIPAAIRSLAEPEMA